MFLTVLCSCGASGSAIITGKARPAISTEDVKVYIDPPKQYETIGIVEAVGDVMFSRQSAQNKVIDKLKSQASKVGANGILLINTGSQSVGSSGFDSNGNFQDSTKEKLKAQARAIYVFEE